MNQFKFAFLFAIVLTFGLVSCGNKAATTEATETTEVAVDTAAVAPAATGEGIEFTSAYVCPMHCAGSGSEVAGKCPACGMDYVMNTQHKKEGNEGHEDHQH